MQYSKKLPSTFCSVLQRISGQKRVTLFSLRLETGAESALGKEGGPAWGRGSGGRAGPGERESSVPGPPCLHGLLRPGSGFSGTLSFSCSLPGSLGPLLLPPTLPPPPRFNGKRR